MAYDVYLERLEQWAEKVLDDTTRLPDDLDGGQLREREALWYADFYTLEDGWLVAGPDDPEMRAQLIEEEGMSPDFADEVLAKMRELGAARVAS
jgi:hypothetical protein